jgi:AAA15 family ATPase/GTPase
VRITQRWSSPPRVATESPFVLSRMGWFLSFHILSPTISLREQILLIDEARRTIHQKSAEKIVDEMKQKEENKMARKERDSSYLFEYLLNISY